MKRRRRRRRGRRRSDGGEAEDRGVLVGRLQTRWEQRNTTMFGSVLI